MREYFTPMRCMRNASERSKCNVHWVNTLGPTPAKLVPELVEIKVDVDIAHPWNHVRWSSRAAPWSASDFAQVLADL